MNDFYLIHKNLFRRKARTVLLLIAIFMAFLIFGVLKSFEKALNAGIELSAANRLVVVNKINFTQPLPVSYTDRITKIKNIKSVSSAIFFNSYYKEPKNFIISIAVEPKSWLEIYHEMTVVPVDQAKMFLTDRIGTLVGYNLANRYGWKVGDNIMLNCNMCTLMNDNKSVSLTIRGIFHAESSQSDTNYLIFNHQYLNESRYSDKDTVGWFVVQTDNAKHNDQVSHDIDSLFTNSYAETRTMTENAFNKAAIEQIGSIGLIITSVVSTAFITVLMVVGSTFYFSITERIKEIAILKTIGFSTKRIFKIIIAESLLLLLVGGIPAILTAWVIINAMISIFHSTLPSLMMPTEVIITAIIWMIILGLIIGIIPALKAMRLNIHSALWHNQ
jgi:putative ABC transport system permease protein